MRLKLALALGYSLHCFLDALRLFGAFVPSVVWEAGPAYQSLSFSHRFGERKTQATNKLQAQGGMKPAWKTFEVM